MENQRERTVFCSCGQHIISIEQSFSDEDMCIIFYELKTDSGTSFWHKIKVAWNYVFKNEGHCEYDIVLSPKEQEALLKAIQDVMKECEGDHVNDN